jgi:acyl-CoA thioester hydrolase
VDSLQIVWHGHYLTYFEEARMAFGRKYGITYDDIRQAGIQTPVVHVSCDYLLPARFDDALEVTARLYTRESAKIEIYYEVRRPADGALLATGQTIQAFADPEGQLLLTTPEFMRDFYKRWEGCTQVDDE